MTNVSIALAFLSAAILVPFLLAATVWLRERGARRAAAHRALSHGLGREPELRSHARSGRGSTGRSSSSSDSDAGYGGAFSFPGLDDPDAGRPGHSDADHSHTSHSSHSSCSSSSCGGGGGGGD